MTASRSCQLLLVQLGLLIAILPCGCNNTATNPSTNKTTTSSTTSDVHDHPSEGPHHGDLIELGNEEYHAEIVHGEKGEITIYMLDSKAKNAVPIDATQITINLSHAGKAEQFHLPAVREENDPQDKSSRFSLIDEELANDLDAKGTTAKLVVLINGKSYTGKIDHHHEGEGGHAHGTK